jgi:hypothetical protein
LLGFRIIGNVRHDPHRGKLAMTKSKREMQGSRPSFRLALSRADVAFAIGVSAGSVDLMVEEGALPPPRKWHSRKLWLIGEIEAYLNEWPVEGEESGSNKVDDILHRAATKSEPTLGTGGYPLGSGRKGDPLQDYYDRLGFDPITMGQTEMTALQKTAEDKWKASIPGTPLGKRERDALQQLRGRFR